MRKDMNKEGGKKDDKDVYKQEESIQCKTLLCTEVFPGVPDKPAIRNQFTRAN